MKKYSLIILFILFNSLGIALSTPDPAQPGQTLEVPVDGGILLALLAGGGITAVLFNKKKNKDEK